MGRKLASEEHLQDRVEWVEHDFFKPQPIEADVYFFRHILHDWSDEDCVKILQALLPKLKDGARVLLSEGVIPPPPATRSALLDDTHVRIDDHVMMAAHNAKERSVEGYTSLFQSASEGFEFVGVYGKKEGVHHSLVEYKFNKK